MPKNIVRFADFRRRRAAPPKTGPLVPRRPPGSPSGAGAYRVVVEVRPPDLVCLTMTRALWSVLADWMASRQVEMTIVPPPRPSPRSPRRRVAAP